MQAEEAEEAAAARAPQRPQGASPTPPVWAPKLPTQYPTAAPPNYSSCVHLPADVMPAESFAKVGRIRRAHAPKFGASIALHPPKFYAAAMFLEQYVACPGAVQAMSVFLVFSSEKHMRIFQEAVACLAPQVPQDAWYNVVAYDPKGGWPRSVGVSNQIIAAYKKWHGIMYMMDMKADAPEYGALLDSELLLYDGHGDGVTGQDCGPDGAWSRLYDRIRAQEASKRWPAAKVSSTLATYQFGKITRSGKDYDQQLIRGNAAFVHQSYRTCEEPGCREIRRQIEECLFSWWTDVPWTNLTVVGRMVRKLAKVEPEAAIGPGTQLNWRLLSTRITWQRFEHLGYQHWTVLHEGFSFRDVTEWTGPAKWGSYMEDPQPGAKLAPLKPLWVSGQALERVERQVLPPLSDEEPPLLVFHGDQGRSRAHREEHREAFATVIIELAKKHDDPEWDRNALF